MDIFPYPGEDCLPPEVMQIGLEVAGVGLGTVDYETDTVRLDMLSAALFGLPRGEDVSRAALHACIHPEDWPGINEKVNAFLRPPGANVIDMTHRIVAPDGEIRWVNARKRVRFSSGHSTATPVSGVFTVVDITEQRRAGIRSRILIDQLTLESRNLMAVVDTIARQLQHHSSPEGFGDRFLDRLAALGRNQDLAAHDSFTGHDLREVMERQVAALERDRQARVALGGPRIDISPRAAQVMAMAAHELLTNATQHGALSAPTGDVAIGWEVRRGDPDLMVLRWTERGGPPVSPPVREGFGTEVLTRLTRTAFAAEVRLDHPPHGFCATLSAPLARLKSA